MHTSAILRQLILIILLSAGASSLPGRGMPAEQRDTIHGLFDSHDKFQRTVTTTDDGYVAETTSQDPEAVKLIQAHVKQMEDRLKAGFMVRSWDPAYVEFVNHYNDIDIQISNIPNGVSIVTVGKTEAAKEVARNHAGIISKFIEYGWKEHDKTHAAVFEETESADPSAKQGMMACCAGGESGEGGMACSTEGEAGGCMMGAKSSTGEKSTAMACCRKAG